jgi:hypothetical protein
MDIRPLVSRGFDLWSPQIITGGVEGFGSGTIQIEYGWQLISIPVQYGYWDTNTHSLVHDDITVARFKNYVLDQIIDLYGSGTVEVANTYTGDQQAFFSYVVGSTPESSPHNFRLVYEDEGNFEISGFWIKSVNVNPMIIGWGE